MKRYLLFLGLVIAVPFRLFAGDDELNVISYYAVGNTLDGQPFIDRVNVLRFYPVFAMREGTDSVTVTIYYGSNIFVRAAEKMDGGRYWQSLLPKFKLGDAIQRIEVEAYLDITKLNLASDTTKAIEDSIDTQYTKFEEITKTVKGLKTEDAGRLADTYQKGEKQYANQRRSLLSTRDEVDSLEVDSLIESYVSDLNPYRSKLWEYYRSALFKFIHESLTDPLYSGPSVKKSDIVVDLGNVRRPKARILYRNDKPSLRRLPALDPAERMGIFRIRYVPFPLVGTKSRPKMNLIRPLGESSAAVFEVGLAFGDAIVPGDEFVVPEFSFKRLGFAFAITEKLFSNEAEIIGLALTYDFNSYGSIGMGGNFAQDEVHGYASFGINKRAFEAVLTGLTGLFR